MFITFIGLLENGEQEIGRGNHESHTGFVDLL